MNQNKETSRPAARRSQWASNLGFILAAAGSAVGLGNIWKFPGKIAAYGGGAFLLCYFLIVFLIGLPVMLAELSIGRSTQKNVVGAFHSLNKRWTFCGGIGVLTLFVIMSYYSIVGGWVLKYIGVYLGGAHFPDSAAPYQDYFVSFISKPVEPLIWGALFLALCIFIIVKGVSKGIEKVSKFLMPCLFLLLLIIVIRSVTLPGAMEGVKYLFTVRPGSVNGDTLVGALGQAFFSLSVGMGIMVTYGSYVPKKDNLVKSAVCICSLDTLVAILAALAIVPVVFVTLGAENLGMGGGFAFMALPEVFARMPGGVLFGLLFFILLFLAALTSAISILESCTAFLTEEFHISRLKATLILAVPMALLGAGYSLSQSSARGINLPWFDFTNGLQLLPMNAVMEKFTDNLMIPLGALCFCLFVGWIWGTRNAGTEISRSGETANQQSGGNQDTNVPHDDGRLFSFYPSWRFIIRFLAPLVIFIILYFTLGKGQGLS